jgi:hypothetical protein
MEMENVCELLLYVQNLFKVQFHLTVFILWHVETILLHCIIYIVGKFVIQSLFYCGIALKTFKLFGFPIFRFWAYLMKVIPAYLMKVIPAYLIQGHSSVPDEGYSSVPDEGYSRNVSCIDDLIWPWLSCLGPLIFLLLKILRLFWFQIFYLWAYLMKVIPETCRAH